MGGERIDEDEMKSLAEHMNPTGGAHTPTPWKALGPHLIASPDGPPLATFERREDRDLALYFANAHAGMLSVMRNDAGSFAFIAQATEDPGLRQYATECAERVNIYIGIFSRLGRTEEADSTLEKPTGAS